MSENFDIHNNHDTSTRVGTIQKVIFDKKIQKFIDKFSLDDLPVGTYITSLDGNIMYSNKQLATILGFDSIEEVLHHNVNDFFFFIDERQKLFNDWGLEKVSKSEYPIKRNDNNVIYIRDIGKKLYDEDNNLIGFQGTIEDITHIKDLNDNLRLNQDRLLAFIHNTPVGLQLINEKGIIIEWNAENERITKIPKNKIIGKYVWDIQDEIYKSLNVELDREYFVKLKSIISKFLKYGVTSQDENEILSERFDLNNKRYIFKHTFFSIKTKTGFQVGIITEDISSLKIVEEKLKAENEMMLETMTIKNIMLNNISHEFRTPLNGILGFSQLLLKEDINEDTLEFVEMIRLSAERLGHSLDTLIVLSEIESNSIEIFLDVHNLGDTVKLYTDRNIPQVKLKNLFLNYDLEENVFVKLDERLFINLMYNLIDNAIKFTNDGGITIKVYKKIYDNLLWGAVEIIDTGIGIPDIKQNVIFEPFRQGTEGLARNQEGLGIGLTIVKQIMKSLNGKILLESEVNIGTHFILLFPYSENFNEY